MFNPFKSKPRKIQLTLTVFIDWGCWHTLTEEIDQDSLMGHQIETSKNWPKSWPAFNSFIHEYQDPDLQEISFDEHKNSHTQIKKNKISGYQVKWQIK